MFLLLWASLLEEGAPAAPVPAEFEVLKRHAVRLLVKQTSHGSRFAVDNAGERRKSFSRENAFCQISSEAGLSEDRMYPIDGDFILKVAPKFSGAKAAAQSAIVSAISSSFAATLDAYKINTKLRIAHFMGQITHECAGFRTTEEFASGSAYEGRLDLGNTEPGDGKRYKGRGLLQLTGRSNYQRMSRTLGLPLEDEPLLAGDPVTSLRIACEYWQDRKINAPADNDDLLKVTRLVNGGLNGLEDRRAFLKKAKQALGWIDAVVVGVKENASVPVLRRGSWDEAVGELQALLRTHGYMLSVDNEFGAATELAVMHFQEKNNLAADGIVSEWTWKALRG